MRLRRLQWRALAPIVVTVVVVSAAGLVGCGTEVLGSASTAIDGSAVPVTPRLTGGSVPGGEPITMVGSVCAVPPIPPPPGGDPYVIPIPEVPVIILGDEGSTQVQTDDTGTFVTPEIENDGSVATFAPPLYYEGYDTCEVDLSRVNDGDEVQFLVTLAPTNYDTSRKLAVVGAASNIAPGESLSLAATLDGRIDDRAPITWVVSSQTDAKLVVGASPSRVTILGGSELGKILVWAQIGEQADYVRTRVR